MEGRESVRKEMQMSESEIVRRMMRVAYGYTAEQSAKNEADAKAYAKRKIAKAEKVLKRLDREST